jgi:Poxvirus Late Transcription Factor VLTF3 like
MPKERATYGTDTPELVGTYTYDYDLPRAHAYVVECLQGTPDLQPYTDGAAEYLQWYEKMRLASSVKFGQTDTRLDPYASYRQELIREYLDYVKAYIKVNVLFVPPRDQHCTCGADLQATAMSKEGLPYCVACGVFRPGLGKKTSSASYSDDVLTRKVSRKETEERDTFVKALVRFQGMQKDRFPSDLFDRLDRWFLTNNYPTGAQVRAGVEHRAVLTKDLMNKAMAAVGYPLYEHTNLICHKVWGWPLPQLGALYELVLQHFDATQRVAHEQGIPSVNTQYRLFKHLEMAGFPCHAVDFRIPKTREIIQTEEEHWRAMCDGVSDTEKSLGIRFIPTL